MYSLMKGGLYMYRFQVNGTQHEVQEDQRLIDFLRADLKLTGKIGRAHV